MAAPPRAIRRVPKAATPEKALLHIELQGLLTRGLIQELVLIEVAPGIYRIEAMIAWRVGRWTLLGAKGVRHFRSLDNLAKNLKTMGLGRTVTRLELLP